GTEVRLRGLGNPETREDAVFFKREYTFPRHLSNGDSSSLLNRNRESVSPNEKHLVLLRDGRTLIGFLRSIDQFANLVLHQTVERIHVGKKYGDIPRGIFVVRGENVVLLGEIDLEKESDTPLQQVSIEEILEEQRVEQQTKLEAEKLKVQALKDRGLSIPRADTLDEY
uniref:U6 snRNA-associated Sm-like protein LSm1 n=1 Tax=Pongo abelii TaxID=9601 RepID=H2PQ30_PONAB